jgi:hypothetical protein
MAYGFAVSAEYMLQLGRAADAEAPAREAADIIRTRWPSIAGGIAPVAEAVVWLDRDDAEKVLLDAERLIEQTQELVARPQL